MPEPVSDSGYTENSVHLNSSGESQGQVESGRVKSEQVKNEGLRQTIWSALSLFTSLGTLVCCALPALFVTLGAGAALAGLVSSAPWLVAFSKYKVWTFGVSGALLLLAGFMRWQARHAPCPTDSNAAKACSRFRTMSGWLYGLSVAVWCLGFFFAFLAVHIFY